MAEQPTFTQGLVSLVTPLATVGAGVYQSQTKSQINAARIKAGKEPCTGQPGQPMDCPAIFAPGAMPTGTDSSGEVYYAPSTRPGVSPLLIVGLLVGAGVLIVLLLPKKKPASARRRRKR